MRLLVRAREAALRARAHLLRQMSSTRDLSHYEISLPAKPNWSAQRKAQAAAGGRCGFSRSLSRYSRVSVLAEDADSIDEGEPLTSSPTVQ